MKFSNVLFLVLGCLMSQSATAQYNRTSHQLGVSVFPKEEQSRKMQEHDENQCYDWAYEQESYNDRNYRSNDNRHNKSFGGKVAKGAVVGTLVGALFGHGKKGLLIGAATSTVSAANDEEIEEERNAAEQRHKNERFVSDFRSCMESKGYSTVK